MASVGIWRGLLVAAALAVTGAPTLGQTVLSRSPLPSRASLERLGLERAWFAAVPLEPGRESLSRVGVAGDLLFAQTDLANLSAFDGESGRLLWSTNIGRPTPRALGVSLNSTLVFATAAQTLVALDRKTGRVVWIQRLDALASSPPAADEEQVSVGLTTGKLVAFNLTGDPDSRFKPREGPPGGFAFAWQTNGEITARPLLSPKVVAFGSNDGKIYAAQIDPNVLLWRTIPAGPLIGALAPAGTRSVIAASDDRNVYSYDLFTGAPNWVFPAGGPISEEPLVAGDAIYILNREGELSSVDPETGSPRWSPEARQVGGARLLAVSGTKVYLQAEYGDLIIVERQGGQLIFSARDSLERAGADLREFRLPATNFVNDRIYVATPMGLILSLRERGALQPRPIRDPNAPAFGTIPGEETTTPPEPDADAGIVPGAAPPPE